MDVFGKIAVVFDCRLAWTVLDCEGKFVTVTFDPAYTGLLRSSADDDILHN